MSSHVATSKKRKHRKSRKNGIELTAKSKKQRKNSATAKRSAKSPSRLSAATLDAAIYSQNGDGESAYAALAVYLRKRKSPQPLARLFSREAGSPLLWCVPPSVRNRIRSTAWIAGTQDREENRAKIVAQAKDWLGMTEEGSVSAAIDALAWVHRLPHIAHIVPRATWNEMLDRLVRWAKQAVSKHPADGPWAAQLLLCELPISLAYNLPEVTECDALMASAHERLSESILELCDGQGMLAAGNVGAAWGLLACWTRCLTMLKSHGRQKLPRLAVTEFGWFVRHILRMTRADGGLAFQHSPDVISDRAEMVSAMKAAMPIVDDPEDKALAKLVLDRKNVAERLLPDEPGYQSDWAEIAFLQAEWNPETPRLAVDYSASEPRCELSNQGEVVFSCSWAPEYRIDGKLLSDPKATWEATCWFSDCDVDYVEIEKQFSNGWTVQRQFLLARQDHFLLVVDNLLGNRTTDLEYRFSLPFGDGVLAEANDSSRESLIRRGRPLATVLPIALPEWRSDHRYGEFTASSQAMELQQSRCGRALTVPLFFDLHKRRMRKPLTWRQLTVAESLRIVSPDEAVGFRVQVGFEQWIIYRSLTKIGNRTLMGQNFSSEFVCGRFLEDGDIESLIEIE